MSETPLIILLLKYFFKLIGYIFSIAALPLTLYSLLVSAIINTKVDSPVKHFFIFIPRFIIVVPYWISYPLLSYLYGYVISLAIEDPKKWVPFVIAIGALFVVCIGVWFTRFASFLKKSLPEFKMDDYFKSLGEALLDLGAVVALGISLVTVIRIPFILMMACSSNKEKKIRTQFYMHLLLLLIDIIALPLFLIQLITVLRMPSFFRYLEKKSYRNAYDLSFQIKIRGKIIGGFFILILQICILLFTWLFLLAPWRIPTTVRKCQKETRQTEKFWEIFVQECLCLLDLLCVIAAIIPALTIYRGVILVRKISNETGGADRRFEVFIQWGYLLWDIFTVFEMIWLVLTIYRLPLLYRNRADHRSFRNNVLEEFGRLLFDIPHILMFGFVLILLWRAPFVIRDLIKGDSGDRRRKCIRHHFKYLFIDVLDLPFIIASFIILITLWRSYLFVCGFITLQKRHQQRLYVFKQFIQWLLDFPTAIGMLFITLTVYRLPETYRQLKEYYEINKAENIVDRQEGPPPPVGPVDEDNPLPNYGKRQNQHSWRYIIARSVFFIVIDIPFPILIILTLWRLPILISRLKEITDPSRLYAQRRLLILRYLMYCILDILCLPVLLLCFITIWRIPTFINIVKNYKRGDNEHKEIGWLLIKMFCDIPFVILGACTLVIPWRGPFLIRIIYRESKSDKDSRIFAILYFGACLLDIYNFIVLVLVCCIGPWRIPKIKAIYSHYLPTHKDNPWRHTISITKGINLSFIYVLADYLAAIQILYIAVFIKQLPGFIKETMIEVKKEGFKLEDMRPILAHFTKETMYDVPHIPLIPIKLAGVIFLPIHMFMKKRVTKSLAKLPLDALHELSAQYLSYHGMDKLFLINAMGILIVLPNELGMAVAFVNCLYIFIVTLGSPLWDKQRIRAGWNRLGDANGILSVVEIIILLLQAITFPAFIGLQGFILLLPVIVSLGMYDLPHSPGFTYFWELLFTSSSFWKNAFRFNAGIWFLQVFWLVVCLAVWNHLILLSRKYFPLFSPLRSYYWVVKKLFAGKIWGFYKMILAKSTRVCFRLRRACFLGEFLMFPLFLLWSCWSIVIPVVTKIYYIFIPSGMISLTLMVFAYRIMKQNWSSSAGKGGAPVVDVPEFSLKKVTIETPEAGGIIFNYQVRHNGLPKDFREVRLTLDSEPLWDAIRSAIGSSKVSAGLFLVGYPIALTPLFMDINDINQKIGDIEFSIKIGMPGSKFHLKKKVLHKFVRMITQVSDPDFYFVLEYGKKDFGWKKLGTLCKFQTKLSNLINLPNDGVVFDGPGDDQYILPPPPPPSKNKSNGLSRAPKPVINNNIGIGLEDYEDYDPNNPNDLQGFTTTLNQNRRNVRNSVEKKVTFNRNESDSDSNTSDIDQGVEDKVENPPKDHQIHIFIDPETGQELVLDDHIDKSNIV